MLVNQLKQPPLGSKLHTNVQSTLFLVFSWMKCYAHSHHSLKHGNTGVHISIQDCSWLLLSPTKELRSPSFLFFSNLKENISDSLWGQYLWAKLCCFLVFLGHVELGILKVILGSQCTYQNEDIPFAWAITDIKLCVENSKRKTHKSVNVPRETLTHLFSTGKPAFKSKALESRDKCIFRIKTNDGNLRKYYEAHKGCTMPYVAQCIW